MLTKTQKGKNVSVERKSGDCFQWQAKGQCTRGDACSFHHDDSKRGKMTQSSLCLKNAATARRKKFFERENHPEVVVHWERDSENRADIALKETVRIRHVIIGILAYAKIPSQNRIQTSAKSAYSGTEVDSQPNKKPKKNCGRGSVALLKNSKQSGCVFQDVEPPKSKSIFPEGHKIPGTEAQRARLKRHLTPRENSEKKGSIPRCYSAL